MRRPDVVENTLGANVRPPMIIGQNDNHVGLIQRLFGLAEHQWRSEAKTEKCRETSMMIMSYHIEYW